MAGAAGFSVAKLWRVFSAGLKKKRVYADGTNLALLTMSSIKSKRSFPRNIGTDTFTHESIFFWI
jgi:hypothetical protein